MIVSKHDKKLFRQQIVKIERILFFILDLSLILLNVFFNLYFKQVTTYSTIFITCNILISLILLIINIHICKNAFPIRENDWSKENTASQEVYQMNLQLYYQMTESVNTLRALRHDMNNHFGIMKGLLEYHQYDLLEQYLSDLYPDIACANHFILLKNQTLFILLNTKLTIAQKKQIQFEHRIDVNEINLADRDICTLLGNILDNAIESAEQCPKHKYVYLSIKEKKQSYYIYCENTYLKKPTIKNGVFVSSKVNPDKHGFGVQNIQSIVRKYDGTIEYSINNVFALTIIIPYQTKVK